MPSLVDETGHSRPVLQALDQAGQPGRALRALRGGRNRPRPGRCGQGEAPRPRDVWLARTDLGHAQGCLLAGRARTEAIRCELCPHACRIAEGRAGICKVRRNEGGSMALPFYGLVSSLALDPIEKKPLHHFLPGQRVFSAGFLGCKCAAPSARTGQISQDFPERPTSPAPSRLRPSSPRRSRRARHRSPIPTPSRRAYRIPARGDVCGEGGRPQERPRHQRLPLGRPRTRALLELCDAANVDLKTWSAEPYEQRLGGNRGRCPRVHQRRERALPPGGDHPRRSGALAIRPRASTR